MSGKFEDPPSASSSSEEEEEDAVANSSSEEEETDSETEVEPVANPLVKPPADEGEAKRVSGEDEKKSTEEDAVANSSSEEEETDSEETDSETEVEPVANPPADSKKVETCLKPETKKRSSEAEDEGEAAKRVKRVSGEDDKKSSGGEDTKKTLFQRVWTEEDEIALLQGIIVYKSETGSNPYDDKNALYDFVKESISFDVTKTQFMEKIRAMKKKFENNLGRGRKIGKNPSFSKAHDRKVFDLAKLVWGDNGIMALESSVADKSKKQEEPAQEFVSILQLVSRFGVDDLAAKQGWSRLSAEDKERFAEQWKALQLQEFNFYSQKSGFIHQLLTNMAAGSPPNS